MEVPFVGAGHERLPVEVLDRQSLFARYGPAPFERREWMTFFLLVAVQEGAGRHELDGEDVELRPGAVMTVVPGQVHRHVFDTHCQARMVLWRPEVAPPGLSLAGPAGGGCLYADGDQESALASLIEQLRLELGDFDGTAPAVLGARGLLAALLWRLERIAALHRELPAAGSHPLFLAFRDALEANLTRKPTVAMIAAELGYSARTLTRACRAASGKTPKRLIDDRLVLQARRLLINTDLSAQAIGRRLGFDDASQFNAVFRRTEGSTPAAYRKAHEEIR